MECPECKLELTGIQTEDRFSRIFGACGGCGIEWEYVLAKKELVEFGRGSTPPTQR